MPQSLPVPSSYRFGTPFSCLEWFLLSVPCIQLEYQHSIGSIKPYQVPGDFKQFSGKPRQEKNQITTGPCLPCLMNKYVVYLSYYGFMGQFDKTVDITFYIFLEKTQTSYTKFIVLWPYQSQ